MRRNFTAAIALYATLVDQRQDPDLSLVALVELRDAYNAYADYERNETHRGTMRNYLRSQMRDHSAAIL